MLVIDNFTVFILINNQKNYNSFFFKYFYLINLVIITFFITYIRSPSRLRPFFSLLKN